MRSHHHRIVWTNHELDGLGVSGRRVVCVEQETKRRVRVRLPGQARGAVRMSWAELDRITDAMLEEGRRVPWCEVGR